MNGVVYYQAYYINGFKFEIQSVGNARVTQNSRVVTVGDQGKVFYGVLTNIMEVKYMSSPPKILFKCICRDMGGRGMKILSVGLVNARLEQLASENEDLKEKMAKQHEDSLKQEGEMCEEMAQLRVLVQIVSYYINNKSFVKLVQSYETNCHVYKYAESFF